MEINFFCGEIMEMSGDGFSKSILNSLASLIVCSFAPFPTMRKDWNFEVFLLKLEGIFLKLAKPFYPF